MILYRLQRPQLLLKKRPSVGRGMNRWMVVKPPDQCQDEREGKKKEFKEAEEGEV